MAQRKRSVVAAVLAGMLACCLSACEESSAKDRSGQASPEPRPDSTKPDSTKPGSTKPGSKSSKPEPNSPVADPEHAVEAPGKRTDRLWSADILVQWDKTISDETVEEINDLKGVAHTERVGLGQVSIENRVLTIAAVDPSTYRLFAQADIADLQPVWERVAGGEMSADKAIAKKLQDESGSITLGNESDSPTIHVGAYVPQVPTVDMVVNDAWAEDIGMASDNGLLISTDNVTPASIRKPLEKLVGDDASVQMLDIASQLGLDPDATLTAIPTGGTIGSVVGTFTYTSIGGGRIAPASAWVAGNIRTEAVPILGTVTCHKDLFPQLRAALLEIQGSGLGHEIHPDEYAGCYYPRFIANSTSLSNHSYGLALDLNVPGNGRGTVGEMNRAVVAIFKKWGFGWGGDWNWTDPMHFELAEIKRPG